MVQRQNWISSLPFEYEMNDPILVEMIRYPPTKKFQNFVQDILFEAGQVTFLNMLSSGRLTLIISILLS